MAPCGPAYGHRKVADLPHVPDYALIRALVTQNVHAVSLIRQHHNALPPLSDGITLILASNSAFISLPSKSLSRNMARAETSLMAG